MRTRLNNVTTKRRHFKMSSQIVAYILIVTEVGREHLIIRELLKIDGVSEAKTVYGEFDVLCIVRHDDLTTLDKSITKIRRIPSIIRTLTLISG